jgi:DNA-binding transcriptional ArsR family regulator
MWLPVLVRAAAAIADSVRRDILITLRGGPMPVNRIAAQFPITRPAVSRHIRILRECGLVQTQVVGREHWCALDTSPLTELEAWLRQFRPPWEQHLDALATEVARTSRERRTRSASSDSDITKESA